MATIEDRKMVVYGDIFYGHYFDTEETCRQMITEHTLCYVYDGIVEIEDKGVVTAIGPGECAFLRRDNRVIYTKKPDGDKPYSGVFMKFKRNVLRDVFQSMDFSSIPQDVKRPSESVFKLEQRPDITSLFQSLVPFFESDTVPSENLMHLKVLEGINMLLSINPAFYPCLFDFTEPWKIDLMEFMNENFMQDLSMEEIASFTGRSLSTFKRDFQKISDLSPQKWLMNKRLDAAREMLRDKGKKITDVYVDVGFKNQSHFSAAFKKKFGVSPSSLS